MSASPERVQSPNVDIKKARRDLYSGRAGRFDVVEVPEMQFLMVDGSGDPNVSADYRRAVEALYTTSYTIRAKPRQTSGGPTPWARSRDSGMRTTSACSPPGTRAPGRGR